MPLPGPADALKGEKFNEPLRGEGAEFILPEGGAPLILQWPLPMFISGGNWPPTATGGTYGGFDQAFPVGLPVFKAPIPAFTTNYLFTQPWMQFLRNFQSTALGTFHPSAGMSPDYSSYFLVAEEPKRDREHGVVVWERVYGIKPDTHNEWETFAYNFIGYMGSVWEFVGGNPAFGGNVANSSGSFTPLSGVFSSPLTWALGRPRLTRSVVTRVQHDYFIAGPTAAGIVTPDYSSPGLIPAFFQFLYKNSAGLPALNQGLYTDYLVDPVASIVGTVPTRTDYLTWVSNAQTYGWNGDVVGYWTGPWANSNAYAVGWQVSYGSASYQAIAPVGPSGLNPGADPGHWALIHPSQLVAEDSRVSRWQGNIYLRQTRFVLAA